MKAAALLALLLGSIGCATPSTPEGEPTAAITKAVKKRLASGGGSIRAREVLPGRWDRIEVAGPYTAASAIEAKTGPDPRIGDSGIESRDDITLLVLISGGAIQAVVEVSRATADFSPLAGETLQPEDCLQIRTGEPPRVERGSGC